MKRILVIKIGAMGDVARSTVMLSTLRERFPAAQVTWLAGAGAAELLELLSDPPEIIRMDAAALLVGNFMQRVKVVLDINRRLLGQSYDLVLIPYRSALYRLLCLGVRAGEVRSFRQARGLIPGRSQCVDYSRLVLGEAEAVLPWPVFPAVDRAKIPPAKRFSQVLLAPGSGNLLTEGAVRRWPLEHYAEVARILRKDGVSVGIIGGSREEIDTGVFAGLGVDDYVGKSSITELFSLLIRADVLVSNDSGPLHCMNLLGGRFVGLFGPTMASEMMGGGPHRGLVVESSQPCSPCYDGKHFAPCTDALCMRQISPGRVLDAINAVLRKRQTFPALSNAG